MGRRTGNKQTCRNEWARDQLCWSFVFTPGKNERPKISKMCRLQQQHETQLLSSSGLIFSLKKSSVCVAMKGEEHPHAPKNCTFCCPLLLSSVVTISEKHIPSVEEYWDIPCLGCTCVCTWHLLSLGWKRSNELAYNVLRTTTACVSCISLVA